MRGIPRGALFLPAMLLSLAFPLDRATAQPAREWTLGVSAGGGAVHRRPGPDAWSFGPVLGGRVRWGNRRTTLSLSLDLQPFRAEGSSTSGDFRALFLLPSYGTGSGGRQLRIGLGVGLFQFEDGVLEDGIDVGLLAGASGSIRLPASLSLELGWRVTSQVRGLSMNVLSVQLGRFWRF